MQELTIIHILGCFHVLSHLLKQSPVWIQITLRVLGSVYFLTLLWNGNYLLDWHTRENKLHFWAEALSKSCRISALKYSLVIPDRLFINFPLQGGISQSLDIFLLLSAYCSQLCFLYVTSLLQICFKIIIYLPNTTVFCYLLGCSVYFSVHCSCFVFISLKEPCWAMVERGGQDCKGQCFLLNLSGQNSLLNIALCPSLYNKSTGTMMMKTRTCAPHLWEWPGVYFTGDKGITLSLLVTPVCSDLCTSSNFLLFSKSTLKTGKWMI